MSSQYSIELIARIDANENASKVKSDLHWIYDSIIVGQLMALFEKYNDFKFICVDLPIYNKSERMRSRNRYAKQIVHQLLSNDDANIFVMEWGQVLAKGIFKKVATLLNKNPDARPFVVVDQAINTIYFESPNQPFRLLRVGDFRQKYVDIPQDANCVFVGRNVSK